MLAGNILSKHFINISMVYWLICIVISPQKSFVTYQLFFQSKRNNSVKASHYIEIMNWFLN